MKTALDPATQKTIVSRCCPNCGKEQQVVVNTADYEDWRYGTKMIQHAMPYLTPDEREVLLSGLCPECWDRMFKEDPEL